MSQPSLLNKIMYDTDNIKSNVVPRSSLKVVQSKVLSIIADAIIRSMGPAGSNTLILKGNNDTNLIAEYSKDGNKIIQNIRFQDPIEMSIASEVREITHHIERVVGDGTSSAVVMSSLIFDHLNHCFGESLNPFQTMRDFKYVVDEIKSIIMDHKRECTLEDIRNITLISTNGNEELADVMEDIYKEHGMNVFIDVGSSIDENSYIREYDGLTLDVGYSDAGYINTHNGTSRIQNPRIYYFEDPIDTPYMISLFETVINNNIWNKLVNRETCIPTVIIAPRLSRDMSGLIRKIITMLYQYKETDYTQKPPLLVITNIDGISVNHTDHIAQLCGCKPIKKYIDPDIEKQDQAKGYAPTLDTITDDFYGSAVVVESDVAVTKFIEPYKMYKKDESGEYIKSEDGALITSEVYDNIINFLKNEYKKYKTTGEHAGAAGSIKRQLRALESNMVEYMVGGVTVSDRESLRDLLEDAVLNCRSASSNGVGYGANYEGWRACHIMLDDGAKCNLDKSKSTCLSVISEAYDEIMHILYATVLKDDALSNALLFMDRDTGPINLITKQYDGKVLTSIMSDCVILDTISKIITIMYTANQALVQTPALNKYI